MHDIRADKIQVNNLDSEEVEEISSGKPLAYTIDFTDFTDLQLITKKYLESRILGGVFNAITGDQTTVDGPGYVNVPITGANIWSASYVQDSITYWINQDQLQSGSIYSFPTEGDFTYTINYI